MIEYLTGANGVAEAVRRGRGVLYVSRSTGRAGTLIEEAGNHGIRIRRVSDVELDRLVTGEHRGFALEIDTADRPGVYRSLEDLAGSQDPNSIVVVLDGITDPGNLGTVIRAADQFGVEAVIVPRRRSARGDADSLSRSSAGAVEWVPLIEVINITRTLESLRQMGYWIWGADATGSPTVSVNLTGKTALVMGREGEGLHRLVKESCDGLIGIPTRGRLDSLNVAVAAGVLIYEARRQQGFPGIEDPVSGRKSRPSR